MKVFELPLGSLASIIILTMALHANACNELKVRRKPIAITRYLDSSVLSAKLTERFSGVGNRFPKYDGSTAKEIRESPFKGLFVIQGKPPKEDSLLDCNIGVESTRYAQIARGGIFVEIEINDIIKAKGKPLTWDDVRVFMDLGIKLRTPKSIKELKAKLEKDSIRIDTAFSTRHDILTDPWFGVFYKETTLKSYIYGIKYVIRNDTLEFSHHEPFFGFRRAYFSNEWLDGTSAVYIQDTDTSSFKNEEKLGAFIEKSYER